MPTADRQPSEDPPLWFILLICTGFVVITGLICFTFVISVSVVVHKFVDPLEARIEALESKAE